MNKMYLLSILLFYSQANAAKEDRFDFKHCQAPSRPYFEEKIKSSYMFSKGEGKLKDIVLDQKNYEFREEIKVLNTKRNGLYSSEEKNIVSDEIEATFDQMVGNVYAQDKMPDFPAVKSNSIIKGSPESGLSITMENLSQEEVEFLPEPILKKLGKSARIVFTYPEKKFQYLLKYDGNELPLEKVTARIQKDFEVSCQNRVIENVYRKNMNNFEIKLRGTSGFGGASRQ